MVLTSHQLYVLDRVTNERFVLCAWPDMSSAWVIDPIGPKGINVDCGVRLATLRKLISTGMVERIGPNEHRFTTTDIGREYVRRPW